MEQSEQEVVTPLPKPAALEDTHPEDTATSGTSVFHTEGV